MMIGDTSRAPPPDARLSTRLYKRGGFLSVMIEYRQKSQKGTVTMRTPQEVSAIINQLCSGLKPLFPQGSMEAILFGSYARGEADADSDIDVMVLVDSSRQDISEKTWEISSVAADLLLDRGVMVSPIVENRRYFQDNMGFLPFYQNIAREGIKCKVES